MVRFIAWFPYLAINSLYIIWTHYKTLDVITNSTFYVVWSISFMTHSSFLRGGGWPVVGINLFAGKKCRIRVKSGFQKY